MNPSRPGSDGQANSNKWLHDKGVTTDAAVAVPLIRTEFTLLLIKIIATRLQGNTVQKGYVKKGESVSNALAMLGMTK